jgi:hypothetical protein
MDWATATKWDTLRAWEKETMAVAIGIFSIERTVCTIRTTPWKPTPMPKPARTSYPNHFAKLDLREDEHAGHYSCATKQPDYCSTVPWLFVWRSMLLSNRAWRFFVQLFLWVLVDVDFQDDRYTKYGECTVLIGRLYAVVSKSKFRYIKVTGSYLI